MEKKFYIVNNGLKDLYGHYYETAISVAEAARDLGWTPILAAHTSCPKDLVSGWLSFHPVLRTDHWMPGQMQAFKRMIRDLVPESLHDAVRGGARQAKKWLGRFARGFAGTPSPSNKADGTLDQIAIDLERIGSAEELPYLLDFQNDLQSLLTSTKCRPGDHVFLPTAHGRELIAVQRIVAEHPISGPTFHLEFRHDLDVYSSTYREQHRVYFQNARTFPASDRIRLYTDTSELSANFERFASMPFQTLPIPFRSQLIEPSKPSEQIRISYFGDARDEKGFFWLPDLIDALMDDYILPGRVSFLIQATRSPWSHSRLSRKALDRLKGYDSKVVRFVGEANPLPAEEYYRLVSETDILLCPYDPARYRCRSSGTFTEAIAAGIPTICPAETWMAGQLPPGGGETFRDHKSFIVAVKRVCDQLPAYRERASKFKDAWNACHSPSRLVQTIVGDEQKVRILAA